MFWGHSVNKTVGRNINFFQHWEHMVLCCTPPPLPLPPKWKGTTESYSVFCPQKGHHEGTLPFYFTTPVHFRVYVIMVWYDDLTLMRQYLCAALPSTEFSRLLGITPSEAGKRRAVEDHRPDLGLDFESGLKSAFTCLDSPWSWSFSPSQTQRQKKNQQNCQTHDAPLLNCSQF